LERLRPARIDAVGDDASTTGVDMIDAPVSPFRRGGTRLPASFGADARPVEIFAPNRHATNLLLEYVAPLFPAEIAPGFVWIVRLQPPATGESWVVELLSVLRRWLEAARLPWANVVYDGRSYLFRASSDVAPFERAAASIRGPSTIVAN
jgi:hypothetical protein